MVVKVMKMALIIIQILEKIKTGMGEFSMSDMDGEQMNFPKQKLILSQKKEKGNLFC